MLYFVLKKWGVIMVKLDEVIEGLEFVNSCIDEYAYFNPETDEIFYIGEYDIINDEDDYEKVIGNSIELPSKFDIDEYSMMEDFIDTIDDTRLHNQLCIAINGSGAFRRFKDTCINFEIIEDWYKFRDNKYREIAIDWCRKNNIDFKE